MGLSFLAPVFLAGLAAIAVPILVHLTHRERKNPVQFPSLMFVRQTPHRVTRRQRIRNWLVFALRVGAVTLLVLAFARPLLRDPGGVAAVAGARELVILLDRSHSMAYGERWSRAQDAVRGIVDAIRPEDRATLILFDERAEAVTPPTTDTDVLLSSLEVSGPSDGVTDYGSALQLAREIIGRSDRPRGEVILVSDFQQSGWDPADAGRLPATTAFRVVDLSGGATANTAITGVSLSRGRADDRAILTVVARVTNFGPNDVEATPVVLELDEGELERVARSIEAGTSATVQFEPLMLSSTPQRGIVRAGSDPLPDDNRFHFVAAPIRPLSVLIVEPRGAPADHALYLVRALEIGHRPDFVISRRSVTTLRPVDMAGVDVVVLNDAPFPAGEAGRRISEHLHNGGGMLVVLGSRTPPSAWPAEGLDVLPLAFGATVDRPEGTRLGDLEFDHPALRPFRVPRSGDFSAARFFRHRRVQVREGGSVLARFEDGSPALVEGTVGAGRVLAFSSGASNFWNDLVVQPVFLPFLHQVTKHLAGFREPQPWFEVGSVVELATVTPLWEEAAERGAELVVESPSGERQVLSPEQDPSFLRLEEAGFYELRFVGDASGSGFTLAANLDPRESDLAWIDPEEIVVAVSAPDTATQELAGTLTLTAEDRERRQGVWWYLLVGAGGLLLVEVWMANRTPQKARSRTKRGG